MKNYRWIALLCALGASLMLSACGGGGDETVTPVSPANAGAPSLDAQALQTQVVSTFAAGLTQTANALPSDTPSPSLTFTPTFTQTFTPTSTLKRPTYIPRTPTATLDPFACYPDDEPVCEELDLTPIGGDCTVICVDSCGETTTSSCSGG